MYSLLLQTSKRSILNVCTHYLWLEAVRHIQTKKINPSMNLRSLIRKEFDCKAQMFDTFERLNINHFEYVELSKITMYVLITYDC